MPNENIEQNNKKEIKKFTARFEGYRANPSNPYDLQILLSEVRDEKDELMHMRHWIPGFEAKELLGELAIGSKVEFEAELQDVYEEDEVIDYMVINPRNIKKVERNIDKN